nr:sporulation initiation factor Spo0A C-terminal domain-containing protein [Mammaliicoccus sp. Marseille-Q6498]
MVIKIAIIEDSKAYVSEMAEYLKTHDIEIVNIGYNGKEALEILNGEAFDVLLLDLILPHIDGMTLLKQYIKPNKSYKVICMSAFVSDSVLKESVALGVDYFLIKPVEFDVLLNTIYRVLETGESNIADVDAMDLLLEKIGFSYNLNGYKYIKYGVHLLLQHSRNMQITKELYPLISEHFNVQPNNVERSIRHAIKLAWDKDLKTYWYNKEKAYVRPTNGELMMHLYQVNKNIQNKES